MKEKIDKLSAKIDRLVKMKEQADAKSDKLRREISKMMAEYERLSEIMFTGRVFRSETQEI
jgi:chaperonin cofactor prefoldin